MGSEQGEATREGAARNVVRLRGRLSVDADARELPSGDRLVLLRVVVPRGDGSREDSVPVAVGPTAPRSRGRRGRASSRVVRQAADLRAGAQVEVTGWLERRFWAGPGDARHSRIQVVASDVEPVAT